MLSKKLRVSKQSKIISVSEIWSRRKRRSLGMESSCKVCVTGSAGYIGSLLVKKLLQKGYTVHATLRNLSTHSFLETWYLTLLNITFSTKFNSWWIDSLQKTNRKLVYWETFLMRILDLCYLKLTYTNQMSLGRQFKAVSLSFMLLLPFNTILILRFISFLSQHE